MKVHVGSLYRFAPSFMDRDVADRGTIVRVINLPGCPKANVMGQCYVEHLGGEFIQMVCTGSLQKLTADEKKIVRNQGTACSRTCGGFKNAAKSPVDFSM